jgi:hypothetical protein
MFTMVSRATAAVGGLALVLSGLTVGAVPARAAVTGCAASAATARAGDIDGDGIADPVVANFYVGKDPATFHDSGVLEVHNSLAGNQSIDLAGFKMRGLPGVVVGDVNGDGCADVIGTFYRVSASGKYSYGLFTINGSGGGLVPTSLKEYKNISGDIALLAKPKAIAVNNDNAVTVYPLDATGKVGKGKVVFMVRTGSEGAGGIEAMAADGNRLVIGMESRKVGRRDGAGTVEVLTFTGKGLTHHRLSLTQNSPGFATAAEAGDAFGFSVAVRNNLVAIGALYETIGKAKQTGMVHVVKLTSGSKPKVKHVYNYSQNSPGIPGKNATHSQWGYSLALAQGVGCTSTSVIVGAPYQTAGTKAMAGTVTAVGIGSPCGDLWSPAAAPFSSVVNTGGFGTALGVLPGAGGDTVLTNTGGVDDHSQVIAIKDDPAGKWAVSELAPLNGTPGVSQLGVPGRA